MTVLLVIMPLSAWYMDNEPGDQRLEHMPHPSEEVSLDVLKSLGVLYWQVRVDAGKGGTGKSIYV